MLNGDGKIRKKDQNHSGNLILIRTEIIVRGNNMKKIRKFTIIVSIAVLYLLPVVSIYGNNQSPEQLFKDARQAPNEEAVGIYQIITKKYPGTKDAARAQRSIGTHYFRQKKYDQAIKAYQIYIDNYPEEGPERIAMIYALIGTVYEEMSDFDMAKKIYEKIINEYPTTRSALSAQEWVHHLNGPEFIENLKIAEKYVKVFDKVIRHYDKGEYRQAIAKAKEVLGTQRDPETFLSAHLFIARCYEKLNSRKQAVKEYKKVIKLAPESEAAKEAQKRIKEIRDKQHLILIASTAGILILIIIGVVIFIKRKKN